VATLVTYDRRSGEPPLHTTAAVHTDEAGRPIFCLSQESGALHNLLARPLASLVMAGGETSVILRGGARRLLRGRETRALQSFRLDVTSVRLVNAGSLEVDVADFLAAEPDPLRHEAAGVLAHLGDAHRPALLSCLRRQGHAEAEWVDPRGLDRYGLELTVLGAGGVSRVRLAFPRPLTSLRELGPGLRAALTCRCGRTGGCGEADG
jgi:hypothetical protein